MKIIIFDDNSLDNSLEIIKKYKNINLIQNNNKINLLLLIRLICIKHLIFQKEISYA